MRAGAGGSAGRLGPCLSPPQGRRPRQCRLLVPPGEKEGADRFAGRGVGSDRPHSAGRGIDAALLRRMTEIKIRDAVASDAPMLMTMMRELAVHDGIADGLETTEECL